MLLSFHNEFSQTRWIQSNAETVEYFHCFILPSRMLRLSANRFAVLVTLAGWPILFELLFHVDEDHGLIWLFLHQLYYMPFGWLGTPFIIPDSDVSFWVQWPGRILALGVYIGLFYVFMRFLDRK
jgi:hypothetical protein